MASVIVRPGNITSEDDGLTPTFTAPADWPAGDNDLSTFRVYPPVIASGEGTLTTNTNDYGIVYLFESDVNQLIASWPGRGAEALKQGTDFVPPECDPRTAEARPMRQVLHVIYSSEQAVTYISGYEGDGGSIGTGSNIDGTTYPSGTLVTVVASNPNDAAPINGFALLQIGTPDVHYRVPVVEWWFEVFYNEDEAFSLAPPARISGRQDGRGPTGSAPRLDTADAARRSSLSVRLGGPGSYDGDA